jgi:subtilisin family serine protease
MFVPYISGDIVRRVIKFGVLGQFLGFIAFSLNAVATEPINDFNLKIEKTPSTFNSIKLADDKAEATLFFNDPYYKKQGFFSLIRAEQAYLVLHAHTPATPAKIGIIDQGRASNQNPEIAGKLLPGSDVGSDTNHGQFVLGIMAASSNNGSGIVGVAGKNSEFLYKSLPLVDKKPNANQIAQYIRQFGAQGFDAVNLSFAIERECTTKNPDGGDCYHAIIASAVIRAAILETARDYKTVFVISAGNSGQPLPAYTTPDNGVLVVGAATKSLDVASYTNHGRGVDLYVAEHGIYGLSKSGVSSPQTGTSFTTPVVTAAVGQVHRYLKNNGIHLSAGELARLVVSTSQFESGLTKKNSSGKHLDFGQLAEEAQRLVESRR